MTDYWVSVGTFTSNNEVHVLQQRYERANGWADAPLVPTDDHRVKKLPRDIEEGVL